MREYSDATTTRMLPVASAGGIAGMAAIVVSVALIAARVTSQQRVVRWQQAFERLPNEED